MKEEDSVMVSFLILLIIIFINQFLLIKSSRVEFSPSWVIFYFWTLQVVLIRILFFSNQWNGLGLVFIQLCILVYCFFYEFSSSFFRSEVADSPASIKKTLLFFLGLVSCFLGIVSSLYFSFLNGIRLSDFLSLEGILEINNRLANLRYSGKSNNDLIHSILQIFVAFTPMLFGYIFGISGKKWTIPFALFPALLAVLLENTKATLIASLVLWFGFFLVGYYSINFKFPVITKKSILYLILSFLVVVILLLFSMMLRIGRIDKVSLEIVLQKFLSYAFGHIIAFDNWFASYVSADDPHTLTWGKYTFFSIFDRLNIAQRPQGVYEDYVNVNQISTNVYTLFRGLVEDFGVSGTIFTFVLLGTLSGYSVQSIKKVSYFGPIFQVIVAFIYTFFMYYIVSILTYTTYFCAFALFAIMVLLVNKNVKQQEESIDFN